MGTVCKANPEFQLQLRQADRLLKEQQIVPAEMAEEVTGPNRSSTPEQNEGRDKQHTSPLKPSLAIPKTTGLDTPHAPDAFGSSLASEDAFASSFIMNASGSNSTNLQENPAPSIDERRPPSLISDRDMMLSPQARQHLNWLTDAASFDLEQEARAEQAAVDAVEALEEEANRQVLHRIYREYAPSSRHTYENGVPSNNAVWRLDGVQLDGPALPPSPPQEGVSRLRSSPNQNTPFTQMSTGHELAFWAEGPYQAPSQASIPSDIEFGNYVPATTDSCLAGATSEMKDSGNDESQEKRFGALHPNPYQTEATASRSDFSFGKSPRNGLPYIYPLPQELQYRLSPNQEILEETIPMRRTKVCRPSILSEMPLLLERVAPENIVGNSGMVEDEERSDTPVTITTMPSTNQPSPSHEDEADNEAAEASSRANSQRSGSSADKAAQGSQGKQLVTESRTCGRSLSVHLYDAVSPVIISPFFQKAAPPAVHNESQDSEVGPKTKSKMKEGMYIKNTLDPKTEHEAAAQEAMHNYPATSLLKFPNARLSSYRPSKVSSEPLSSVRAVSNETIGPAKVGLIKSATARSQASSSLPVEDLLQTFYTTFIERSQTEKPSTNTLPIGKVIPQIHLAAIDPSPGSPSGWFNLSTKKRLSSQLRTASPAPSAGVAMYKQMKHASKASDTFSTAIRSGPSTAKKETLVGDGHAQRQGSMPAANVARSAASESNKCNPTSATETPTRPPSGEQANEVKRSKVKKPKRNAPVPDADVQRDLDLIEAAIIRKNAAAANSNMGKKRPATSSDLEQKRVMKKPRKSNGRARGAVSEDEIDVKPTQKELENASGECHRGTRVGGRNKEKTRPIDDDRNLDKVPSRDRKSKKSSTNENVQSEGTPQVKSEDAEEITEDENEAPQSSEEHPGQNFLREIHRKRKFAMLSKENKFTADSR